MTTGISAYPGTLMQAVIPIVLFEAHDFIVLLLLQLYFQPNLIHILDMLSGGK